MFIVLWDVDPLDWSIQNEDAVVEKVLRDVKDGDIILLHDIFDTSVRAAIRIVDALQKEGYEFVTVEELMFPQKKGVKRKDAGGSYRLSSVLVSQFKNL